MLVSKVCTPSSRQAQDVGQRLAVGVVEMAAHFGQRIVLQRTLQRRLHAPRRAHADGVGHAAMVDADVLHQPHHALHLVGAHLALVGAAQRAGDGAAHLQPGRVRGGHHGAEAFDALGDASS